MYKIDAQGIEERLPVDLFNLEPPISQFPWKVIMNTEEGGYVKEWSVGANDFPVEKIRFALTEKGCAGASLVFNRIDIPIIYGHQVFIDYNGKRRYSGYVSNEPSPDSDTVNIEPYSKRLKEITFNSTFTNKTFVEMLSTVVSANSTNTGVLYNEFFLKYSDTTVYANAVYKYETIEKLISDYYENEDDVFWGVDANRYLYISKRSEKVSKVLYSGDNQGFGGLSVSYDYGKIQYTRANIFQKSTVSGGESNFIAIMPDGSTVYPYIDNENKVGIKYTNLTAPTGLNSTECKDWAYGKLKNQRAPLNVKLKDVDLTRYDLSIGDLVEVHDMPDIQLRQILSCDSTDGWTGLAQVVADSLEGTGSIQFNANKNTGVYYDFGDIQHYLSVHKLVFFAKSETIGCSISLSLAKYKDGYSEGDYSENEYSFNNLSSEYLFTAASQKDLSFRNANTWQVFEVPVDMDFRYIGFRGCSTSSTASIQIDDVKIYGLFQNVWSGNVIKLSYSIDKMNDRLYDAELGDYDAGINDLLFMMEKKIQMLEQTQKGD